MNNEIPTPRFLLETILSDANDLLANLEALLAAHANELPELYRDRLPDRIKRLSKSVSYITGVLNQNKLNLALAADRQARATERKARKGENQT